MNVITLERGALHRDEVAGAVYEVAHRRHWGMRSQLAEEVSEEVSALCRVQVSRQIECRCAAFESCLEIPLGTWVDQGLRVADQVMLPVADE